MSAWFWSFILIEAYLQGGIQVRANAKVAEFSHLQIPKHLVDNPTNFPSIRKIPKSTLGSLSESNPVLICSREMMVEVHHVPNPKKTKSKSKGWMVIQEPFDEEQPQKKRKLLVC